MISSKIKKTIEENAMALATVDKKNNPNVIGVAGVKVISDNQIVITDNYMNHTRRTLLHNNHICLAVWNKNWQGYKLIGTAKYHSTGKWKKYVEALKENKGMPAKGAIVITISKIIPLS